MSKDKNLELWDGLCTSEPRQLKKIQMRGGYISIDPQTQVKKITEQFGPCGEGWRFESEIVETGPETLCVVRTSFFFKRGDQWSWPVMQYGASEWVSQKGRIDPDAAKKATTDSLTKTFSYIGTNSDVFEGEWDKKNLDQEQAKASATLSKVDQNTMITLMKEFNDLVPTVPEDIQGKARKFVEDNPTIEGVEKAIARLKAVDTGNNTPERGIDDER